MDRGEQAAGSSVEGEPRVLPECVLAESCQALHITPDGPRVRLMLLRHRVGVERVLTRQIQPLHDRIDHLLACRTEFLGGSSQEYGAISGEICVEGRADLSERVGPGVVNRRTNVPAPKAGDMVKT